MSDSTVVDEVIFQHSMPQDEPSKPFVEKSVVGLQDLNGLNYGTHTVIFSTAAAGSSRYMNMSEAYLQFPVLIAMQSDALTFNATTAAAFRADYLAGLKSGSWQLIHALSVDINGSNVIAPNPFQNLLATYNAVTTLSEDDIKRINASIFFTSETDDSWIFRPDAATSYGQGLCNNHNGAGNSANVRGGEGLSRLGRTNAGFLARQRAQTLFGLGAGGADADAIATLRTGVLGISSGAALNNARVSRQYDGVHGSVFRIFANVRLADICSLFKEMPMCRGVDFRITCQINAASFTINKHRVGTSNATVLTTGSTIALTAAPQLANGSNPIMVASTFGSSAESAGAFAAVTPADAGDIAITFSVSVGDISPLAPGTHKPLMNEVGLGVIPCMLYVPSYSLFPMYESRLLAESTRKIEFDDYLYTSLVVAPNSSFLSMLSPGIKAAKRVLIVPHIHQTSMFPALPFTHASSPFCELTTAPLISLTRVNARLGGVDVISGGSYQYSFEFFMDQLQNEGSFGGFVPGCSSGLINRKSWSMGTYGYYPIDVSRYPVENSEVPMSLEVSGQNNSDITLLLHVFTVYRRQIVMDLKTGMQIR